MIQNRAIVCENLQCEYNTGTDCTKQVLFMVKDENGKVICGNSTTL